MKKMSPLLIGCIGGVGLIGIYFLVLSIANSPSYALSQFITMRYYFILLSLGFGIQLSLYAHVKRFKHDHTSGQTISVAASGGMSSASMIACCLHHLADFMPLLGLSAAALFFTNFQITFIVIGICSNAAGIMIMLQTIQENQIYKVDGVLSKLYNYDMKKTKSVVIFLAFLIVFYTFVSTYQKFY